MAGDHPLRLRGALLYTMQQSLFQDGHSFLKEKSLLQNLAERLEVDAEKLKTALGNLVEEDLLLRFDPDDTQLLKLKVESENDQPSTLDPEKAVIAMRSVFELEQDLSQTVRSLAARPEAECEIDPRYGDVIYCNRVIAKAAAQSSFKLEDEEIITPGDDQIKALQMALTAPFSILTGGPGTGKTSTVRLLTKILLADGLEVKLAAPTGRAARRMEEVCRVEATTIHRLLDLQVDDDYIPAIKEYEKIDADYLIIDECSMIDLFLFYRLLKSVDSSTQVLLIGDADQLPSIGPGQVLRDLLADEKVQVTRLQQIYRQEKDRLIVRNAHHIIRGEDLEFNQSLESDFLFIERDSETAMLTGVLQLCERILPEDYGIDGIYGAQVVSPIRRGVAGVENINQSLQEVVQGMDFPHVSAYGKRFAVKDKVMQLQNDYQLSYYDIRTNERGEGVMNGELGVIQEIDLASRSVTVLFEGEHLASISYEQLDNIDLAYATTIHKTQGSEYPVVILVLPQGAPPRFLNRNLLYTAVTRARQRLFILSRKQTLRNMIRTAEANRRRSLLSYFLKLT
ncbi:MAG: AAA family ATPase, partial [Eubacteriales bacterium]|nr:AAA family ATPase [Eubacteriales bacterium]